MKARMHTPTPPAVRSGSTLTEVLVALMISSIGLVSVATLFPMSVLRSIKAAQTTSATDARVNAEAAIDRYPDLIKHPDSRSPFSFYTYNANTNNSKFVDPPWSTLQLSGVKNFVIDPLGYLAVQNLNLLPTGNTANAVFFDYHVHFYGNDVSGGNLPPWPGNPPGLPWLSIPRYPYNCRTQAAADALAALPDSWTVLYETIGGTLGIDSAAGVTTPTQITLPGLNFTPSLAGSRLPTPFIDRNPGAPYPAYPQAVPYPGVRVVMFSGDGSTAQTRTITSAVYDSVNNNTTLYWTEDINSNGTLDVNQAGTLDTTAQTTEDINGNGTLDSYALPASFYAAISTTGTPLLGKVRVELQDRRYTWLLTVRQSAPGVASVDVVVFFNRALENISTDEVLYHTVFTQGSTQAQVTYPTGINTNTGLPLKPYMKRGNFVFDANNAFWYRIANVSDNNNGNAVLTLEVPANASTGNPPFYPPRAMFPRGVVDVFPIGTKTYQ